MNLPHHEPDDAGDTHENRHPDQRMRERVGFDVGEAEHQPAEAEDGEAHGEEVRFRIAVGGSEVVQPEEGEQDRGHADDCQRHENRTPSVRVGLPPADNRSDGGRDAHRHADGPHGESAAGERVDGEYGNLQDRPHDAGTDGFEDSSEEHDDECRPEPGEY